MKNPAQAQAQAPGLGCGFRSCEAPSSSSSSFTVECCMCGDVGFQDRLFRCRRCRHRLQHTYCSRLYSPGLKEDSFNVCDWCLDNEAKQHQQQQPTKKICCQSQVSAQSSQSHGEKPAIRFHFKFKKSSSTETAPEQQQAAAELDNKDKEKDRDSPRSSSGSKAFGGARRYKLLSDVLC